MWNLKSKTNELTQQNRNTAIDTEGSPEGKKVKGRKNGSFHVFKSNYRLRSLKKYCAPGMAPLLPFNLDLKLFKGQTVDAFEYC